MFWILYYCFILSSSAFVLLWISNIYLCTIFSYSFRLIRLSRVCLGESSLLSDIFLILYDCLDWGDCWTSSLMILLLSFLLKDCLVLFLCSVSVLAAPISFSDLGWLDCDCLDYGGCWWLNFAVVFWLPYFFEKGFDYLYYIYSCSFLITFLSALTFFSFA